MNKTVKWILIAVLIIAVIAFGVYLFLQYQKGKAPVNPNPNPTPPTHNSLLDILGGLLNPGWLQNLFGGDKPGSAAYCKNHPEDITNCNSQTDCYNGCKSSMPGYDCAGNISAYC